MFRLFKKKNSKSSKKGSRKKSNKKSGKKKNKKWIQKAIKHPGRVKNYLIRKYGKEAVTKDGELNQRIVDRAIRELKQMPPGKRPKGMLQALYLARRFELMRKDRKKKK